MNREKPSQTVSRAKQLGSHLYSWVMLSPANGPPFTPLPNEKTLFVSPPRIGFSITTPVNSANKHQQQSLFSLSHSIGSLYLTNRRIIYIPDKPTERLKSFGSPILNLHDSHVTAPFFGPNVWTALLQPVRGGGIPVPNTGLVEVKMTFKEGGAFDFHTHYERIRERLQQAVEVARVDGDAAGGSRTAMNGIDMANVNLDDLPAYQEQSDGPLLPPTATAMGLAGPHGHPGLRQRNAGADDDRYRAQPKSSEQNFNPPSEPPPGYDETQLAGLQDGTDHRFHPATLEDVDRPGEKR